MHGDALTTLADMAVGLAIKTLLPEGTIFATTSLTINCRRPVVAGVVTAVAEVTGPVGRDYRGVASIQTEDGAI